jgi:transposase InsO family protein
VPDKDVKKRERWIRLFEETHDAGLVCRRCGISRPTLRKWLNRYKAAGPDGLNNCSNRPHRSPKTKVGASEEQWILELRRRNLGARRIQGELRREHQFNLSLATIHKVLLRHQVKPLVKLRRKKTRRGYARPIPGDRVQMDTINIAPGLYQYTAVDDCTRYKVLALFPKRTATNTLTFIDQVIEEMPFPIQRIQTDRGREFFAYKVQEYLMDIGIKFRPIKPASPHLNGKVERAQKTDLIEFYATVDIKSPDLRQLLGEWQHFYNWFRPHGSLKGNTPMERYFELNEKTPFSWEVEELYDASKERLQIQNYRLDLELARLKRSV